MCGSYAEHKAQHEPHRPACTPCKHLRRRLPSPRYLMSNEHRQRLLLRKDHHHQTFVLQPSCRNASERYAEGTKHYCCYGSCCKSSCNLLMGGGGVVIG